MYFDTHCHLNSEDLYEDHDMFIQNALDNDVTNMVVVGYDLESSKTAIELAKQYEFIYAAVGIGPNDCKNTTKEQINIIDKYLEDPCVVALGEIGLDYHWDVQPHEVQKYWFVKQMELAKELDLPIAVHSRDAAKDTLDLVKDCMKGGMYGGIIHCFSYGKEMAREYLDMGLYLGIGGVVTFKNAKKLKEVVAYAPLEQLVLETDSPYLSPEPNRGKRNSSLNLPYVAEAIAQIKGCSAEEVIAVTEENAKKLLLRK